MMFVNIKSSGKIKISVSRCRSEPHLVHKQFDPLWVHKFMDEVWNSTSTAKAKAQPAGSSAVMRKWQFSSCRRQYDYPDGFGSNPLDDAVTGLDQSNCEEKSSLKERDARLRSE